MMNTIKRVLITGPTGAVGVALINECIKNNIEVYAVVRKKSKRIDNLPKSDYVHLIECDLNELLSLKDKIKSKIDVFYHFGWDGTYGDKREDLYLQINNIKYSLDAVELAHCLNCSTFVGAGSQSEYGKVNGVISPSTPCFPTSGYGMAKLCASDMTRNRCKEYKIKHIRVRIISLFGPKDGDYTFISSAIRNLKTSDTFKVTECDQVRSYIYSKDAARAFLLVADKGVDGSIYCFGGKEVKPLKEFLMTIKKLLNSNCEIEFGAIPYYKNQAMHLEADMTNLYLDTGFKHQYSFADGVLDLISNKD